MVLRRRDSFFEHERLVGEWIGNTNGEIAGEQVIDHLADDFGPPTLGKQRDFAVFETAEVESVGDQIADILSRAGEAGSDLRAAADAAEGRAEELAEQVQLRT